MWGHCALLRSTASLLLRSSTVPEALGRSIHTDLMPTRMSESDIALSAVKKQQQAGHEGSVDSDLEAQRSPPEAGHPSSPLLEPDEHEHFSHRAPWLRAGVLGATDGLVSVASLMMGVGGGSSALHIMILAGLAGLVGGALSMAVGEYISVASQKDAEEVTLHKKQADLPAQSVHNCMMLVAPVISVTSLLLCIVVVTACIVHSALLGISLETSLCATQADIEKEKQMQAGGPAARQHELEELAAIYENRGLSKALAKQVAIELTKKDVIRAHARDELGIDVDQLSNPLQACVASAFSFCIGAGIPLLSASFITNHAMRILSLVLATSAALTAFGSLGAWLGGANMLKGAARVILGGLIALGITYGIGRAFGSSDQG